jgi:hypothetical protein
MPATPKQKLEAIKKVAENRSIIPGWTVERLRKEAKTKKIKGYSKMKALELARALGIQSNKSRNPPEKTSQTSPHIELEDIPTSPHIELENIPKFSTLPPFHGGTEVFLEKKRRLEAEVEAVHTRNREKIIAHGKQMYEAIAKQHKDSATPSSGVMEAVCEQIIKQQGISDQQARRMATSAERDKEHPVEKGFPRGYSLRRLYQNLATFHQLTGGSTTTLKVLRHDRDRAYADSSDGSLNVGTSDTPMECRRVIFHEAGHHFEFSNPAIAEAAKNWIKSRASGEIKSMSVLTGSDSYNSNEKGYPDKFIHPYVGKVYNDSATEVISMGLELFAHSWTMHNFHKQDPEHFYFVLGAIHTKKK